MAQALIAAHDISIHALREEGDRNRPAKVSDVPIISIHALREEGDCHRVCCRVRCR